MEQTRTDGFKRCINGHYFRGDVCPYCGMRERIELPADWSYNDDIDSECAAMFPTFCTLGGIHNDISFHAISKRLHQLRERATEERDLENSEWYILMHLYIDEYAMKVIQRKHCYRYGVQDWNESSNNSNILHTFWNLKKAIIMQDYGLNWLTPEERFKQTRTEYFMRT